MVVSGGGCDGGSDRDGGRREAKWWRETGYRGVLRIVVLCRFNISPFCAKE